MTEQTCPHCRRLITDQDLVRLDEELKKEARQKEFNNLSSVKKIENSMNIAGLFVILSSLLMIIVMSLLKFDLNRTLVELYGPYTVLVAFLPSILGLVMLFKIQTKRRKLYAQFVLGRLE